MSIIDFGQVLHKPFTNDLSSFRGYNTEFNQVLRETSIKFIISKKKYCLLFLFYLSFCFHMTETKQEIIILLKINKSLLVIEVILGQVTHQYIQQLNFPWTMNFPFLWEATHQPRKFGKIWGKGCSQRFQWLWKRWGWKRTRGESSGSCSQD